MAVFSLKIDGVETEILIEGLNINAARGNRGTLVGSFLSEDGSLDIPLEAEMILLRDAVRMFRGVVVKANVRGAFGAGGDGVDSIIWDVTAKDSSDPLDYRLADLTIPAGTTLKAALILLMALVPELTLDPTQVTGPTLPTELVFERKKLRDAFNQLISEAIAADTDGWFLRVTHFGFLEAIAPGDAPAPFDLTEGDGTECADIEVNDQIDDDYATRVIVEGGIVTEIRRAEVFAGDGVTATFTPDFTPFVTYGYIHNSETGADETLRLAPNTDLASWEYDAATKTLTALLVVPGPTALITFYFDGTKQIIGDTGATSPGPDRVVKEQVEGLLSTAAANAAAARLLVEFSASQKTARYPTRRHGLQTGDAQVVTTVKRKVPTPTTFYVQEIVTTYDGATEGDGLLYQVNLAASQVEKGNFRATFRLWARVGESNTSVAGQPSGVTGVGPGGPVRSVQFNDGGGRFGGDAEFIYYKDENSVVCGLSSLISAAAFESCQVFGVGNEIGDA